MSETYNITLDSQLGERLGTLTLDGNGRSVSGIIRTGRAAMQLRGTRVSPDTEDNK